MVRAQRRSLRRGGKSSTSSEGENISETHSSLSSPVKSASEVVETDPGSGDKELRDTSGGVEEVQNPASTSTTFASDSTLHRNTEQAVEEEMDASVPTMVVVTKGPGDVDLDVRNLHVYDPHFDVETILHRKRTDGNRALSKVYVYRFLLMIEEEELEEEL